MFPFWESLYFFPTQNKFPQPLFTMEILHLIVTKQIWVKILYLPFSLKKRKDFGKQAIQIFKLTVRCELQWH